MLSEQMQKAALGCLAESAKLLKEVWDLPREVSHKGPIDLVTSMDVRIQKTLSAALEKVTPGVAIVAEEGSMPAGAFPERCWVIDPIDGTTNFVHAIPMVGISVAYCEEGRPVFAMLAAPMLNETWHAAKGHGAFLNGRPIHVSKATTLLDSVIATGFPYDVAQTAPKIVARLSGVLPKAQGMRRMGAASLDLAYVATGRMDGYYEGNLKPWDYMAGWLLILEAGGTVTNDEGGAYEPGQVIVATNGAIHDELLLAMHEGDASLKAY